MTDLVTQHMTMFHDEGFIMPGVQMSMSIQGTACYIKKDPPAPA
jgi:hypothetical protein